MKLVKSRFPLSILSLCCSALVAAEDASVEKIIVYGDFQQSSLAQLSASASILEAERLQSRPAEHIEDILRIAPNVNFSSGASRGRFVQIRGIGERSQYAEPINPSVSIMVDDFDFAGLGAAALLFDTQQVEIFRGPQATVFGAGALAGAVLIKSTEADAEQADFVKLSAATKNSYQFEVGKSVSLSDALTVRGAAIHNQSDGFVHNSYLQRDDTNNIDESAVRLAAKYAYSDDVELKLAYRWYDIDNGFDAFTLDNIRETLSDEPGFDRQQTQAVSANLLTRLEGGDMHFIFTHASHDLGYGYDEDWTFEGFHPWGYTSTDYYYREVDSDTVEVRLVSADKWALFNDTTSWVIGGRIKNNQEDLLRQYTYADGDFVSRYQPVTKAVYGQLDSQLTDDLQLSFALRAENYDFTYSDNQGMTGKHDSTMLGGKLALSYQFGQQMAYVSVSRGFKGAGINPAQNVTANSRFYDEEYNWNYEAGLKGRIGDSLTSRIAVFVMKREDTQISDYELQYREDGSAEFIDIIKNADLGTNQGFEAELSWQALDNWSVSLSAGYLDAYFEDYTRADGTRVARQQQAQAPKYTANVFSQLYLTDALRWNVELDYTDRYRFSDGHNVSAPSRVLLHTQLSWQVEQQWQVQLWINNALNKTFYTRGFGGFSNDPRDYYAFEEPYYQLGNGRQTGVTLRYQF
ncbi:TonB-dependent receptor [Alteromonas lipolytica]|uniref:TonB-dependent receptor n=1 Tax=Alteromonas lipolytica TaxID=1856405 RepID=A0A1E8FJX7_9ALTE|nr:TonB-dependent receptor [Alteromonas lipolytica]OFI35918.1 TonB-dependent receptor [Alteromonas lipolytica]GGF72582.1 TonB-dependent receptor [Alteromonas lipolytica]